MSIRQSRRKEATRQRLLDAALAAFLTHGYQDVTLAQITERADVGTGTLYLHFSDKRSLYEAVARRALRQLFERWLAAAAGERSATEKVILMVSLAIELFIENRRQARLFLCDGPPLEDWLVDEVAQGIGDVLGDSVDHPHLLASMVAGTALAAGRSFVRHPQAVDPTALIRSACAFSRAGIAAARRDRRENRT